MMMIRLMYFSRHRLDDWYASRDCGIADILTQAVPNNLRDDITGVLVCDERWFMQVLEGAQDRVSAAFERILRDQRHRDVSLVTMQAVAARRYPDLAMNCVLRGRGNGDLFRHYGEDANFDPRQMRADRLSDLIEAVVQRATTGRPEWMTRSVSTAA